MCFPPLFCKLLERLHARERSALLHRAEKHLFQCLQAGFDAQTYASRAHTTPQPQHIHSTSTETPALQAERAWGRARERAESGETDAEVTGGDEAGGVSQRTPNLQLHNGQLAAVVVCASACRQASTKVIRAATGFIGAHGDGGRQFGQILAGFGEGLI